MSNTVTNGAIAESTSLWPMETSGAAATMIQNAMASAVAMKHQAINLMI